MSHIGPIQTHYPGISPVSQAAAAEAHRLGLHLTSFAGYPRCNPFNGFRVFEGRRQVDHHQLGFLVHLRTLAEVSAFLAGYSLARRPVR